MDATGHTSFRPPWYLRSGHVQTILGPFVVRPRVLPNTRRFEVPLEGGGATYLYDSMPETTKTDYAVLLAHGLGGSHASPYLTRIASLFVKMGIRAIRVDLPGCGPAAAISDRAAHAGCSHDLKAILEWASLHLDISKWRIAGFSLGGNITLKLLAELAAFPQEAQGRISIERALVVAPPVDLAFCSRRIEKGFNLVYNKFFLRTLKRLARERSVKWPRWQALQRKTTRRLRSLREFDDAYTAPISGYDNAGDYYARCSTQQLLNQIQIPTTVLVDEHDPIVPASLFNASSHAPCVQILRTHRGGHLGYIYRNRQGRLACWMDQWVVDQLSK